VDWLTKPAKKSYGRAILDYSDMLKPLFQVYDRQGAGVITFDDFVECHAILQTSLAMHPRQDGTSSKDVLNLSMDAEEAFRVVDKSQDGCISFTDFVNWMRELLDTEGMAQSELAAYTSKLAKILSGIFHLNKMAAEDPSGCLGTEEEALLRRLVENLAKTTEQFEHAVGEIPVDEREKKPSTWTSPPVGLSIQRLKGQHMKRYPVSARNVESIECDVLCVPMPEGAEDPENRVWVAEVVRIVVSADGKRTVDSPQHYMYERDHFRWVPTRTSQEYETALDRLPQELTVFCILKTQADFGVKIGWAAILKSLKCAVDMDLISSEQRNMYVKYMESKVMHLIDEDRSERASRRSSMTSCSSGEFEDGATKSLSDRSKDLLLAKLEVKPLEVMATLTQLGIVRNSALVKNLDSCERSQ